MTLRELFVVVVCVAALIVIGFKAGLEAGERICQETPVEQAP